jgi:hypothetical protein
VINVNSSAMARRAENHSPKRSRIAHWSIPAWQGPTPSSQQDRSRQAVNSAFSRSELIASTLFLIRFDITHDGTLEAYERIGL